MSLRGLKRYVDLRRRKQSGAAPVSSSSASSSSSLASGGSSSGSVGSALSFLSTASSATDSDDLLADDFQHLDISSRRLLSSLQEYTTLLSQLATCQTRLGAEFVELFADTPLWEFSVRNREVLDTIGNQTAQLAMHVREKVVEPFNHLTSAFPGVKEALEERQKLVAAFEKARDRFLRHRAAQQTVASIQTGILSGSTAILTASPPSTIMTGGVSTTLTTTNSSSSFAPGAAGAAAQSPAPSQPGHLQQQPQLQPMQQQQLSDDEVINSLTAANAATPEEIKLVSTRDALANATQRTMAQLEVVLDRRLDTFAPCGVLFAQSTAQYYQTSSQCINNFTSHYVNNALHDAINDALSLATTGPQPAAQPQLSVPTGVLSRVLPQMTITPAMTMLPPSFSTHRATLTWLAASHANQELRSFSHISREEVHDLATTSRASMIDLESVNGRIDAELTRYLHEFSRAPVGSITIYNGFHRNPKGIQLALRDCCTAVEAEGAGTAVGLELDANESSRRFSSQLVVVDEPLAGSPASAEASVNQQRENAQEQLERDVARLGYIVGPMVLEATTDGNNRQNFEEKMHAIRSLLCQQNPTLASLVSSADLDIFLRRVMLESSATVSNYAAKTAVQLLFGKAHLVLVKPSNDSEDIHPVCVDVAGSTLKMHCPSTWYIVEDLPSLSLLSRNFDPDDALGIVDAVYIATCDVFDFVDNDYSATKSFPLPQIVVSRRSSGVDATPPLQPTSGSGSTLTSRPSLSRKVDRILASAKKLGRSTAARINSSTGSGSASPSVASPHSSAFLTSTSAASDDATSATMTPTTTAPATPMSVPVVDLLAGDNPLVDVSPTAVPPLRPLPPRAEAFSAKPWLPPPKPPRTAAKAEVSKVVDFLCDTDQSLLQPARPVRTSVNMRLSQDSSLSAEDLTSILDAPIPELEPPGSVGSSRRGSSKNLWDVQWEIMNRADLQNRTSNPVSPPASSHSRGSLPFRTSLPAQPAEAALPSSLRKQSASIESFSNAALVGSPPKVPASGLRHSADSPAQVSIPPPAVLLPTPVPAPVSAAAPAPTALSDDDAWEAEWNRQQTQLM
ncbi:hypothetical protein CAOG_04099 [Capsaspora owczarzaki ATCC 30864]|uniref:Uncharacterized protein n=1 Tax=Capsaspora owczarzaki (strain ATCC 30864) TaxID=595528 RepID=A0A0D2VR26_CAPO3|nr:hypothetical protein CAOG_04099 [Capsaspora owczarzaki ATCC 30864]KJE93292.1 hypothetical protein CAOG_004099 [Capsaspora owczarzaki ATCC 30864]|eukprot:XP_004347924.2 hypothetical protein CAOG_04099 [Capsaspora owczarzaki ATCC 30864]